MDAYSKVLAKIKKKPSNGHIRANIENISSLSIANREITELLKKSVFKENKEDIQKG